MSDERLGEPATNRDLFDRLATGGWISKELAAKLGDMAGFRNVLIHGYQDVDLDIVVDAARNRLEDPEETRLVRSDDAIRAEKRRPT